MLRIGLAAFALAVFAFVGSAAGSAAKASLRFASTDPVKVRGAGFYARERVRVTLTGAGPRRVRLTTTNGAGAFVVAFSGVQYDPCNDLLGASATGQRGDRAGAKLPQRQCPPTLDGP